MRHRKHTVILDRKTGPRGRLLKTLAVDVVLRERVRTTAARARAVQPIVEHCLTLAAVPTLSHRRALLSLLHHPVAVEKLLTVLGPRYQGRPSGRVRRVRALQRVGDGAVMEVVEFVAP